MVVVAAVTESAKTATTKLLKMLIHLDLYNEMSHVFSGRSLGRKNGSLRGGASYSTICAWLYLLVCKINLVDK